MVPPAPPLLSTVTFFTMLVALHRGLQRAAGLVPAAAGRRGNQDLQAVDGRGIEAWPASRRRSRCRRARGGWSQECVERVSSEPPAGTLCRGWIEMKRIWASGALVRQAPSARGDSLPFPRSRCSRLATPPLADTAAGDERRARGRVVAELGEQPIAVLRERGRGGVRPPVVRRPRGSPAARPGRGAPCPGHRGSSRSCRPRVACPWERMSGTVSTRPAGTPAATRSSSHSSAGRAASLRLQRGRRVRPRWRFLASRSAKRGSVASSGAPTQLGTARRTASARWRRCSARPAPVRKVPDGAAVKLSLPIGTRHDAGIEVIRHDPAHRRERRVEHRDVHERIPRPSPVRAGAPRRRRTPR